VAAVLFHDVWGVTSVRESIQILGLWLRRIHENAAAVSVSTSELPVLTIHYSTSALASAAASSYTPIYLDIIDSANGGTAVPLRDRLRSPLRVRGLPQFPYLAHCISKPMYLSIANAQGPMKGEGYAGISPGTFLLTSRLRKLTASAPHVRRIQ